MFLDTVNKSIQVLTDGVTTTESKFSTSYGILTNASETVASTPGSVGTTTNTTPVTAVPAPSAGQTIVVKEMIFFNLDSVPRIFTVRLLDTATAYNYVSVTVAAGGFLRYGDPGGWQNGPTTGPGSVSSVAFTGDGTVFNSVVPGSPVTTTGTFAPSLHTQSANAAFLGPSSGAAAAPTFRPMVAADIPSLSATYLPLAGGTMTGPILLPNASAAAPALSFTHGGFFDDTTNSGIGVGIGGSQIGQFAATGLTFSIVGGAVSSLTLLGEAGVQNSVQRFSNDVQGPVYQGVKARGTIASPANIVLNDILLNINFRGYVGGNKTGATIRAFLSETGTPSGTAFGTDLQFFTTAIGSGTNTEVMRLNNGVGLSMLGANVVIDANRLLLLRNFTVATLPAAPAVGATAFVTDAVATIITGLGLAPVGGGANKVPVYYDGAWKIG